MTQSTTRSGSSTPLPSPKERRRLREAKSMSEQELATAVGVTKATIRSWESGRSAPRGRRREMYTKLLTEADPDPGSQTEAKAKAEAEAVSGTSAPETNLSAEAAAPMRKPVASAARPAAEEAAIEAPRETAGDPVPVELKPVRTASPAADPEPDDATAELPPTAGDGGSGADDMGEGAGGFRPEGAGEVGSEPGTDQAARTAADTEPRDQRPVSTPAEAFDALYTYSAPGLVRQAYLLTGRRRLAHESVERAFHLAWQRWPEVARDRDPAGWVRAAAYEFAMSPWQRLRPVHRHPDNPPLVDSEQRELLEALLELPPPYRRTLLLYDGLGLDLPDTAAETEASTPAAANRLLHAREAIAEQLPHLSDPTVLRNQLLALANSGPVPQLNPPRAVRTSSERRAWLWTRAALSVTTLIMGATGFTLATAPTQYEPAVSPGHEVGGVPPLAGPQPINPRSHMLRQKLLSEPVHGPERLVPTIP
ncbi:sigma factor-like helix-turn-helix DNA-binding protein [Streptomyces sp. AM8-1-1]|uniref:sigma factor-like helix-turn-helix DNA-binding protein n=1 Tax=Streptomyces sp. AM8-1-1 TaxID=3075825 RepID=UPI0028C44853|nr:sigma factor-like helix-turn-helix DNA-binding protein [Streptomyces sp. AM8-1-1]WNO72796.1 sigma factor-like helix-turn-helix DNA-binding protein [Streptomyces sp. AM8-1-1]